MGKLTYDEYAYPRWANNEGTAISCMLIGAVVHGNPMGDLPFLATNYDVEDHGKEIYSTIKSNQEAIPILPFVPRPPPPPATAKQLALARTTVAVSCASIPALDGDYPVTEGFIQTMMMLVSGIHAGLGLPSGSDTFFYQDAFGANHDWPSDKFLLFAKGVMQYIYQMKQAAEGAKDEFPSPTIVIP